MALDAPVTVDPEGLEAVRSLDLAALRPMIERVCRLAAALAGADHAYVVLNEDGLIWHSAFGDRPEALVDAERSTSIRSENGVWIEDAAVTSPDHPWVVGWPFVRLYVATPLRLSSGLWIGSLCVLSAAAPRARDPDVEARLADCAAMLSEGIERLRAQRAREVADREARAAVAVKEAVLGSAPVALSMVGLDLRYVYANDVWLRDTGLSRERVMGAHVGELFPETFGQLEQAYGRCLAGETVRSDRIRLQMPGRPDRWLRAEIAPWRDADGAVAGVIAMSHDISDVIGALDRAERSEQRLKLALEIADVLVYELDFEARTLRTDGAGDTFFGGQVNYDLISRDPWAVVHPEDKPRAVEGWNRHLAEGVPFRTEYRMVAPDGREVWAFSGAELALRDDGRPARLLGVLKNITDRKRSEEQVLRARDAAEAANRAKSEFLANMSHEIRTPLNGVMGIASALARTGLSPAQAEMVELIQNSGQTLEAILSDLLDLARIESGRLDLKAEPFALGANLRAAGDLFRPLALDKGLAFDLDIDPVLDGWFEGDAVRLRQVVGNLLSNAVKFTAAGGVTLSARLDDGAMRLEVRDSGIGFEADFKARLFDRFEQADGSITRRFGGTGLGLAISHELAAALGGTLSADSEPGVGSIFTLTLPLTPAPAPAALQPAGPADAPEHRAPRVLLAEDHAVNRRVVQLLLEPLGVELTCVENGAEAVEAAQGGNFDLILMDMQMPVMDGLTAIRKIRESDKVGRRPIWALSANALPEHVRASAEAGADGHLTKPISAQALYAVVELACAAAEPAAAA